MTFGIKPGGVCANTVAVKRRTAGNEKNMFVMNVVDRVQEMRWKNKAVVDGIFVSSEVAASIRDQDGD